MYLVTPPGGRRSFVLFQRLSKQHGHSVYTQSGLHSKEHPQATFSPKQLPPPQDLSARNINLIRKVDSELTACMAVVSVDGGKLWLQQMSVLESFVHVLLYLLKRNNCLTWEFVKKNVQCINWVEFWREKLKLCLPKTSHSWNSHDYLLCSGCTVHMRRLWVLCSTRVLEIKLWTIFIGVLHYS